jgi:uracil-DNA glycosylase
VDTRTDGIVSSLNQRYAEQARKIEKFPLDFPSYARACRDPWTPILIGSGTLDSEVGFFGRDPGNTEVEYGDLFVGSAGKKITDQIHHLQLDRKDYFWANTVPYKPIGNKPWSMKVKKAFRHLNIELLEAWRGRDLITFGNHAFFWFGIESKSNRQQLLNHWYDQSIVERYTKTLTVVCGTKSLRLYPLPHPSGLNTHYAKCFDSWFKKRINQVSDRL